MTTNQKDGSNLRVIGVGASAGGLEACSALFASLRENQGQAFVLAQHMSPQHKSNLVELLAKDTNYTVSSIRDGQELQANTIYVNPPNHDIEIIDGKLRLQPPSAGVGPKPSVDRLFNSMAVYYRESAIGIILSGTGSDGTIGCKAIQDAGGITVAQQPNSAKYDGMPVSAIRARAIDKVLEIGQMVEYLSDLSVPSLPSVKMQRPSQLKGEFTFEAVLNKITDVTGINFLQYKRATLERQLQRRMIALQIDELEDYFQLAYTDEEELLNLQRSFLISVTAFFRDPDAFDALRTRVSEIINNTNLTEFRVWAPACATGEEAYSLAIMLSEICETVENAPRVRIFATDVDEIALDVARSGIYTSAVVKDIPSALRIKYFQADAKGFRISKRIRDMCMFATHNILSDPPFLRVNLLACRNLLIYLENQSQEIVMRNAHYALSQNGLLFLGKSETVSAGSGKLFVLLDKSTKIFKRSNVENRFGRFQQSTHISLFQTNKLVGAGTRRSVDRIGHQFLLDKYVPPSAILNDELSPVEFIGDLSPFLSIKQGPTKFDIISLVKAQLQSEVRAVLNHVARKDKQFVSHNTMFDAGNGINRIIIEAFKIPRDSENNEYVILSFQEVVQSTARVEKTGSQSSPSLDDIDYLELQEELVKTKEHLQAVIEELETSNEELQSINEELQASSEELQASNEELETTNEELQATNEELSTVNDEMQAKSILLSETVDTLDHIQRALDYGILLLDRNLRVTRFTPHVVRLFGLIEDDIGSSILKVPSSLEIPNLESLIQSVLISGQVVKTEVQRRADLYLMTISPYRKSSSEIAGVVLSFLDFTQLNERRRAMKFIQKDIFQVRAQMDADTLRVIFSDDHNSVVIVYPPKSESTFYGSFDFSKLYDEPLTLVNIASPKDRKGIMKLLNEPHGSERRFQTNSGDQVMVMTKELLSDGFFAINVSKFQ